jgi:hypothetical protein
MNFLYEERHNYITQIYVHITGYNLKCKQFWSFILKNWKRNSKKMVLPVLLYWHRLLFASSCALMPGPCWGCLSRCPGKVNSIVFQMWNNPSESTPKSLLLVFLPLGILPTPLTHLGAHTSKLGTVPVPQNLVDSWVGLRGRTTQVILINISW